VTIAPIHIPAFSASLSVPTLPSLPLIFLEHPRRLRQLLSILSQLPPHREPLLNCQVLKNTCPIYPILWLWEVVVNPRIPTACEWYLPVRIEADSRAKSILSVQFVGVVRVLAFPLLLAWSLERRQRRVWQSPETRTSKPKTALDALSCIS
jgi:hypothetical protein